MKHNKRREYEQAPLGFLWEEREKRRREFRLDKWKKHQIYSLKKKQRRRGRRWKEKSSNKQHWLTIKAFMGCFPGRRALLNGCWEGAWWAVPLPWCWCDCRNVGTEAPCRENLSVDLELLHCLPPSAIIHSSRTPHEADDGCLACGPSTLAVVWDNSEKTDFWRKWRIIGKAFTSEDDLQHESIYNCLQVYSCL